LKSEIFVQVTAKNVGGVFMRHTVMLAKRTSRNFTY